MKTPHEIDIHFGRVISNLRQLKGWTQEDLAEVIGLSRISVSKIERAKSAPKPYTLLKLSRAFGVTIDELFESSREQPATIKMFNEIDQLIQDVDKRKKNN